MMEGDSWKLFGAATAIRLGFLLLTSLPQVLENRIEVANAQIGIKAIREAIFLLDNGVPVYHQTETTCRPSPLVTAMVRLARSLSMERVLFVGLDLMAALLIYRICGELQRRAEGRSKKDEDSTGEEEDVSNEYNPLWSSMAYLFHPFTLVCCLGSSSATFSTLLILASFLYALKRWSTVSMVTLAAATMLAIYPITFIVPLLLLLTEGKSFKRPTIIYSLIAFILSIIAFIGLSWLLSNVPLQVSHLSDVLLWATPLGCNFLVTDLRPNIGLAWYLFVEMFDHFRSFFLAVFQMNIFIYLAPASLKFHSDPVLLMALLVSIQTIFKPYPTLADSSLMFTFIAFTGQSFLGRSPVLPVYIFCMVAFAILGPINWYYWVQQGSGNANFFYAITLFYATSHICLILDILYRWLVRDVERRNPGVSLEGMYHQ